MQTAHVNTRFPTSDEALESMIRAIANGQDDAIGALYTTLHRGLKYIFFRNFQADADDLCTELFGVLIKAIQEGELREYRALYGYARTVAGRLVGKHLKRHSHRQWQSLEQHAGGPELVRDCRPTPEQRLLETERTALAQRALAGVSEQDREILTRFYVLEQSQETICAEMRLTPTQFRLAKSRAKARFAAQGQKLLRRPVLAVVQGDRQLSA